MAKAYVCDACSVTMENPHEENMREFYVEGVQIMDYEKIAKAVRLCGSSPSVIECSEQCAFYTGADMSKCIPQMTQTAAAAIEKLADHLISNGVTFGTDINVLNKWISVSERLPEDYEAQIEYSVRVLGFYCALEGDPEASETWEYVTTAMYDSDNKLWVTRGSILNALMDIKDKPRCGEFITHWMPLPEPPKECE